MIDNLFYLYCRFKGNDKNGYYTNNKNYLLEVRVGRFNNRVKIAHVHGYEHKQYPDSQRRYDTKESFEQTWKVIRDVTQEA